MNYQAREYRSNMTSKCQVTIPKEIRDALGLKAGDRVRFILSPEGNARIVPANSEEAAEDRKAKIMQGVREARAIYNAKCVDLGMSNDAFFDLMRGPPAER
jgi:AbrB family looped-hinge helix DNA binding protein